MQLPAQCETPADIMQQCKQQQHPQKEGTKLKSTATRKISSRIPRKHSRTYKRIQHDCIPPST